MNSAISAATITTRGPELYQGFNVDVCEIQSQGLELLVTRQAESMLGEGAEAYVFETLTDIRKAT